MGNITADVGAVMIDLAGDPVATAPTVVDRAAGASMALKGSLKQRPQFADAYRNGPAANYDVS